MERQCKRCLIIKDILLFPSDVVNGKEYKRYKCKDCRFEERRLKENYSELKHNAHLRYYNKNRELVLKTNKRYKNTDEWKIRVMNSNAKRQRTKDKTYDWSITWKTLKEMLDKQNNKCNICGKEFTEWIIKHLDHIKPLCLWWEHTIKNVQYLCRDCNLKKWANYEY